MGKLLGYLVPRLKLAYGRSLAALATALYRRPYDLTQLVRIGTAYGGWYCDRRLLGAGKTALCCGAGEDISVRCRTQQPLGHAGELRRSYSAGHPARRGAAGGAGGGCAHDDRSRPTAL